MSGINEYAQLVIMAVVSVLVLFILSKLLGKKQIAQLEFIDYVIGISIGSIAASMATDTTDHPIWFYIIAMVIFFLFDILITYLSRTSPKLKNFFQGKPVSIIYDGKINYKALKKSKLDVNDVIALCRDKGYFDLSKIAFAIFENSGKLSVLPVGSQTPTVAENFDNIPVKQASLPYYLVVDGCISFSSLSELNKDKEWLLKEMNIKNESELNKVILAIYDAQQQKVLTTYKND